jgi:hypothetical protein
MALSTFILAHFPYISTVSKLFNLDPIPSHQTSILSRDLQLWSSKSIPPCRFDLHWSLLGNGAKISFVFPWRHIPLPICDIPASEGTSISETNRRVLTVPRMFYFLLAFPRDTTPHPLTILLRMKWSSGRKKCVNGGKPQCWNSIARGVILLDRSATAHTKHNNDS